MLPSIFQDAAGISHNSGVVEILSLTLQPLFLPLLSPCYIYYIFMRRAYLTPVECFTFCVRKGIIKNTDSPERLRLEHKPRVLLAAFRGRGEKEMFILKKKKMKLPVLVLAILLLVTSLSGCGGAPAQNTDVEVFSSETSSRTTVRERMRRQLERQKAAQESSGSSQSGEDSKAPASSGSKESSGAAGAETEEKLQVGPGLEDIAQLIGLKAGVETSIRNCVVDVDEGENPYDVTWDYGKLYDAFVQEVDWDLLFDGDYYIQTFPGLAHLYHKDKALLLKHFQTVGIHEGRQGCKDFNVAAYQKNCDARIREAFGDSYECYYFYYAMNQKTQKKIVTTGSEKKQLTTKLTRMQQKELDMINQYREEVGVAPLEYDAELSALACYRAYIDALEDWDAHDWLKADENQDEVDWMINMIGANLWGENTVHGYPQTREYALQQGSFTAWYINYRYSQSHYDAMVAEKYHYVGSANCYVSDYIKENPDHPTANAVYVHFDVFVPKLTTPTHN